MTIVISRIPRNNYQGRFRDRYRVLNFRNLGDPIRHVGEVYFVKQPCWQLFGHLIPVVKKAGLYRSDGKWRRLKNLL